MKVENRRGCTSSKLFVLPFVSCNNLAKWVSKFFGWVGFWLLLSPVVFGGSVGAFEMNFLVFLTAPTAAVEIVSTCFCKGRLRFSRVVCTVSRDLVVFAWLLPFLVHKTSTMKEAYWCIPRDFRMLIFTGQRLHFCGLEQWPVCGLRRDFDFYFCV